MHEGNTYEVQTHWGWFRLDEGAYQDYLAGKLWICFAPGEHRAVPAEEPMSVHVSAEALYLREQAARQDAYSVLQEVYPTGKVELPYRKRMSGVPIEEMCLSVRSSNCLMRAGASTFGRLEALMEEPDGLRRIRNLGTKSEKEITLRFFQSCYSQLTPSEKAAWWQSVIDANNPMASAAG